MVHLNKFSPSIFGLYAFTAAAYSWFIPNVKAQDEGLDTSNTTADDTTSTDSGITTTTADPLAVTTSATADNSILTSTINDMPTTTTDQITVSPSLSNVNSITTSTQMTDIISSSSSTITTTPTLPSSSSNSTNNTGAIVGGVIGGIAGLIIIGAAIFLFLRKRKRSGHDQEVFHPDSVEDEYQPAGAQPSDHGIDSNRYEIEEPLSTPPPPPRHSYYDPNNRPIVY
ncbi:hypothetical protein RO3G_16434 [Rhizopus delemar RA 99-880]|uniref:Mid2 domain-containing protein n=1 Tax=Rhizopus delemar (strain RA 99-880 / ATCC MYA-4621 / FGSC 9543 / NRRL 43880) TaxID=246409 RepID=I1CTE3_RHIO9|nr:hypothetical protein RO3G_16434 [Rhizopus delemar RA 99-880]|eukprot:EIE91723.1 hypothetical protein RO3G_16434 [Rhizopus delemar RA 99-880]